MSIKSKWSSRGTVGASSPVSEEATFQETPSSTAASEIAQNNQTRTPTKPRWSREMSAAGLADNVANLEIANGDDFLNAPRSAHSQLSPTASEFTPRPHAAATNASHLRSASVQTVINVAEAGRGGSVTPGKPMSVSALVATSIPEDQASPHTVTQGPIGAIGQPVRTHGTTNGGNNDHQVTLYSPNPVPQPILFRDADIRVGEFTHTKPVGRHLSIINVNPHHTPAAMLERMFSIDNFPSLIGVMYDNLFTQGRITVSFRDTRESEFAQKAVRIAHPTWKIVNQYEALAACSNGAPTANVHEGQVIVSVYFDGRNQHLESLPVLQAMEQLLRHCGQLKAMWSLVANQGNVREFHVEYYDIGAANKAVGALAHTMVNRNLLITVESYNKHFGVPEPPSPATPGFQQSHPGSQQLSITGRSLVPSHAFDSNMVKYVFGQQSAPDANSHNRVVLKRIRQGLDVRTTIMLRNIPNKISAAMLKAMLDETSHGDYDFMYLRIDFSNNFNVGYAFINFKDAESIMPFAIVRAGQRWNAFQSDKIAEISYATIQGRDCLVAKFRNSSVMMEHPDFRPKLYGTGNGSEAGEEEQFPGPDNPSKMRRSIENAEHVGLYPPRYSQDNLRHQRSQFDRGTPGDSFSAGLLDPARSPRRITHTPHQHARTPHGYGMPSNNNTTQQFFYGANAGPYGR